MRGERERVNVSVSVSVAKIVDQGYPLRSSPAPMRKFLPVHLSSPLESALDQHRARLLRYVVSIIRDRGDAEDLLQEILLRAHRGFANLRAGEAVTTWLFRIATNEALMLIRKRKPQPQMVEIDRDDDELEAPREIVDWCCIPEPELLNAESRKKLDEAIQHLPLNLRTVFLLRDVQALSGEETAAIMGISVDNVKTRLLRARLKLREELSVYYGERSSHGDHKE